MEIFNRNLLIWTKNLFTHFKLHLKINYLTVFVLFVAFSIFFSFQSTSEASIPSPIESWVTSSDQSELLVHQSKSFFFENKPLPTLATIQVNPKTLFQKIDGFGFSLTGGSAQLIHNMDPLARRQLLEELFSPQKSEGIHLSFLRLSIGASDLSDRSFSYNDIPEGETDIDLKLFNLYAGDIYVVPVLKEILKINPEIGIIAVPWSAPLWMKNNYYIFGGKLLEEYYETYARYFIKYLTAMKKEGILIQGIVPQNEPLNGGNEPSMIMTSSEQSLFIKKYLGPALKNSEFANTELIIFDHNCDTPEYPIEVLSDTEAYDFISGSAWHLYGGNISALSTVKNKFPEKKIYFTEQWTGSQTPFSVYLGWHIENVVIGSLRNWSSTVIEWNLASDPELKPHTPGGCDRCLGALTINGSDITRNVSYYIIGQISKFVPKNSIRIETSNIKELSNVAFKTPNDDFILLVYNSKNETSEFNIEFESHWAKILLKPKSAGTFIWKL